MNWEIAIKIKLRNRKLRNRNRQKVKCGEDGRSNNKTGKNKSYDKNQ